MQNAHMTSKNAVYAQPQAPLTKSVYMDKLLENISDRCTWISLFFLTNLYRLANTMKMAIFFFFFAILA